MAKEKEKKVQKPAAQKSVKAAAAAAKGRGWRAQVFLIASLLLAVVFLPTTFLLCIGMLPTPMAALIDRSRQKTKVMAVGSMNLAGCSPFLIELWRNGNDFEKAFDIVTDPKAIIVMYAAAAIGYMINWAMTGIVSSLLYEKGRARQKAILEQQEELRQRWGEKVTGKIPLDEYGFPVDPTAMAGAANRFEEE